MNEGSILLRYEEEGEIKKKQLEGGGVGYSYDQDFVRIWKKGKTFAVPREKVLTIEESIASD